VQYIIPTNHACRIVTNARYINRTCLRKLILQLYTALTDWQAAPALLEVVSSIPWWYYNFLSFFHLLRFLSHFSLYYCHLFSLTAIFVIIYVMFNVDHMNPLFPCNRLFGMIFWSSASNCLWHKQRHGNATDWWLQQQSNGPAFSIRLTVYVSVLQDIMGVKISVMYRACINSQREWPLTLISRSRYSSTYDISKMVQDRAVKIYNCRLIGRRT